MSQSVGSTYKSLIPTLSDNATIEEALRVYHYGTDNWVIGNPIPDDSIEGNFVSLATDIATINSTLGSLNYVRFTSATASPNVIIPEANTGVPLTLRGASGQTGNILQIQNSSSTNLAVVFADGAAALQYVAVGSTTKTTTTALNVTVANAAHKGATIKGASSQTGNLQEWQDSTGAALAWVTSAGKIYTNGGEEVGSNVLSSFLLMGG